MRLKAQHPALREALMRLGFVEAGADYMSPPPNMTKAEAKALRRDLITRAVCGVSAWSPPDGSQPRRILDFEKIASEI